ncbi:MAG: uracil-DNA glycosylase, partial [Candidatus Cloacimonetes bacterium]|nr:uracil-DNA glycosylase [Candidatus Cloacimonadota bacterium]
MLNAINIEREDIYITNVVKCCPPGNRDPHPEEILACQNYLLEQIAIIKPKILLILGKVAAESILKLGLSLTAYREKTYLFQGIKTYVSYHPAALLRNVSWKRYAWTDLQKLQKDYEKLLNKEN